MKASLFVTYPLRSLRRGGGSTQMALICIAIGVMAVVAIQLIGLMATSSYVNSARTANGGDISMQVADRNSPITQSDLAVFERLKREQTIQGYTPVNLELGAIATLPAPANGLLVQVVDPAHFPLVTAPTFVSPASGSLKTLLTGNQVVVTQTFLTYYHKHVGDTFALQLQSPQQNAAGRTLQARLAGVIANTNGYGVGNTFVLVSFATYQAANLALPVAYDSVDLVTQDQAHTDQALRALQQQVQQGHLPPASFQTATEVQQHVQAFNEQTTQLQELAGLLVLLIAGLGILNTMRMLLARRTLEIALLKTMGYSRSSLALLFGIETGTLGLLGGLVGTSMALAISYGVVTTLLLVPFQPDPWTLGSGLALGTGTALSFGLMPIVQSAQIRPIEVLRGRSDSGSASGRSLILLLYGLIVLLFCLLASVILRNLLLACASVCGAVLFLVLLSLCLRPLIWGISTFSPPEHYSRKYLAIVLVGIVLAVLLSAFFPVGGGVAMVLLFLALAVKLLPHPWKMNTRIALRNLGRRPMRTIMLVLILFVGVFVIGSLQVVGQDLQSQLAITLNQTLSFNVVVKLPQNQARAMRAQLTTLPDLLASSSTTISATSLVAINGQPWQSFLPSAGKNGRPEPLTVQALRDFDGVEGYDLSNQQTPDPRFFHLVAGRNLQASDAGTNHVLIPYSSALAHTLPLTIGSTLTVENTESKTSTTLTVIGEYTTAGISLTHVSPILTPQNIVMTLAPATAQTVFYLKVNPTQVAQTEARLEQALPGVAFVPTPASDIDSYLQGLSNIVWVFTVIVGFVLLAGMVIMANTVVLDLFERRRELGILKALGYTQQTIRGEILLEYGIIGGTSAVLAIVLVALLANLLGNAFLRATASELSNTGAVVVLSFSPNGWLLASLVGGAISLVLITSLLASWRTVQRRPLDVLRYE
ncbi:ABC transporter permease [Ktedonobacter racemifer]|uniref:ABC3 transporter permease protein domain-containing protein n=1 Tax=Ktedonobacter racemifer DSM 44963 TaxID=485913 RepID=D6TPK6_KTERA|nr:FtsX-like permease family protein [Ktedonobacter racemifer]EFH85620.1 protein of unknown function DUF214 [Ktedonobacter racemifer DSM 44963]